MPFALQVNEAATPGAVIVSAVGEIDIASAPALGRHLAKAVAADPGSPVICCDLSETVFLDSSGMGALVAAHKIAESHGRELWIVGAHGPVLRALTVAALDKALTLYDSVDAVNAALAGRTPPGHETEGAPVAG